MWLTVRPIGRTGAQAGPSDPPILYGMDGANEIKVTLGITGLQHTRVHIACAICHLDVDLAYPSGAQAGKGPAVRRLKCYMSWVQIRYLI